MTQDRLDYLKSKEVNTAGGTSLTEAEDAEFGNYQQESHLRAILLRLSHERDRLANAKTKVERELRAIYVSQIEKELAAEKQFLGIKEQTLEEMIDETDEELLRALGLSDAPEIKCSYNPR